MRRALTRVPNELFLKQVGGCHATHSEVKVGALNENMLTVEQLTVLEAT